MSINDLNQKGGLIIEEFLRAASVLIGYWLLAASLVRLIDIKSPDWWVTVAESFMFKDLDFGIYILYGLMPALLGILMFAVWRPKDSWVRWLFAPLGLITVIVVG